MTRAEHLAWAKERALEYLPGDPEEALMSMFSDLRKHPELGEHPALLLGGMLMLGGHLADPDEARRFITGFN